MSQTAGGRRALLWTAGGGMQDLGDLAGGLDSSTAEHIHNAGQILVSGLLDGRSVQAIPMAWMGGGALACMLRRARRAAA